MRSPKLYTVIKITLKQIVKDNFNVILTPELIEQYQVKQQDNQLFEIIRKLTKDESDFIKGIVFVDCHSYNSNKEDLIKILTNGFRINDVKFVMSLKSASMARTSQQSFVKESISEKLNNIILNGVNLKTVVLSKFLAYQGLALSSSISLGKEFNPYVIVVDDYTKILPKQKIKCLVDEEKTYVDKNGITKKYKEKTLVEKEADLDVIVFDGWGVHKKNVTEDVKRILNLKEEENPTTIMWRNSYFKGLTTEIDFVTYCSERGIFEIEDIYGVSHSIYAIDIIATKSMFKGYNYYNKFGKTYKDWEYYLEQCKINECSWRVVKYNITTKEEYAYTKNNYQNLQCLDLPWEKFKTLSDYSKKWIESIIFGDKIATYSYLGLFKNKMKPSNNYMYALLKNPEFLKDTVVKKYLGKMLKKSIDKMKCGRIYLKGAFRFVIPDVISFLEYITKQEVKGILKSDEFYTMDINGVCNGEYSLFRNPRIHPNEGTKLKAVNNPILEKYCSHLTNICIVNNLSPLMAKMQGFDQDGDILVIVDNKTISDSIDMDVPIIADIENKATAMQQEVNQDNIVKNTIMSFKNVIGEFSNYSTTWLNKGYKTQEQRQKYLDYVAILSIAVGKSVDYSKCGVLYFPPKIISKGGRPLPYFMKYISPYYAKQKRLSNAPSNMNLLARDIEHWEKSLHHSKKDENGNKILPPTFDYSIMTDLSINWDNNTYLKVKELYQEFDREFKELKKQQRLSYKDSSYYNYFGSYNKNDISNTNVDWSSCFMKFKKKANDICSNQKELANYAVTLCYSNDNYEKNFPWIIAEQGILDNIKPVEHYLPQYDPNGEYEYLGKHYTLIPYKFSQNDLIENSENNYTEYDSDDMEIENEENLESEEEYGNQSNKTNDGITEYQDLLY